MFAIASTREPRITSEMALNMNYYVVHDSAFSVPLSYFERAALSQTR